ncbi:MAG: carbohydrate kinase family protein [Chloroflexota bacterium]|jgi:sugar/nucleoside kinase (ribokinase family)|nr:carbohydrate kinase family protein [Chloroflexota bacterium]
MPDLSAVPEGQFRDLMQPGRAIQAKAATLSTGGAVSNTGLALHKLGVPVRLIGKIGDDLFGRAIQEILGDVAPRLVSDLAVDPSGETSYTIILNPPGFDRTFIHSQGVNNTFYASDLPRATLEKADLFHFGYPSLMRSIYRGGGGELVMILRRARRAGLTTSLDFSLPDPTSPAGEVDWPELLANVLPFVDLFLPSVAELIFLLRREEFDRISRDQEAIFIEAATPELLEELSSVVMDYGVKVVMVKCGERGIYLRTAEESSWRKGGRGLDGLDATWHERQLWVSAFKVNLQGTTGAGDAAIAGFLSTILQGKAPEDALIMAAAAGACSVEGVDSISGLRSWEAIVSRVKGGWETLPLGLDTEGWRKDEAYGLWKKT